MTWQQNAACAQPEHAWLPWVDDPDPATSWVPYQHVMARVCMGCPVRAECAQFAEDLDVVAGFWAGTPRTQPNSDTGFEHDAGLEHDTESPLAA